MCALELTVRNPLAAGQRNRKAQLEAGRVDHVLARRIRRRPPRRGFGAAPAARLRLVGRERAGGCCAEYFAGGTGVRGRVGGEVRCVGVSGALLE
jgi:hypothetical protein